MFVMWAYHKEKENKSVENEVKNMDFFDYIVKDMKEVVVLIPEGIMVGVILCILVCMIHLKKKRAISSAVYQGVLFFIWGVYGYVFLQQALFTRLPGSRNSVNMVFLGTWGTSLQAHAYVIENIIMFIPFGILLSLSFEKIRKNGWLCVISGLSCSVLLEAIQYVTERGHCQLDDVVMNVVGTIVGWMVVRSFGWIYETAIFKKSSF